MLMRFTAQNRQSPPRRDSLGPETITAALDCRSQQPQPQLSSILPLQGHITTRSLLINGKGPFFKSQMHHCRRRVNFIQL